MIDQKVRQALDERNRCDASLAGHGETLTALVDQLVESFSQEGRLIVFGSGPFGEIANLTANLFVHRLGLDRPVLPAVSLSHNATLAQALGRKNGFEEYFARQVKALLREGDVLLGFAEDSHDEAVIQALCLGADIGCVTALVYGGSEALEGAPPDHGFFLEASSSARLVEGALFFGHLVCELVEQELFGV